MPDLYFTSNQGEDKLYLNQGNFKFKDVTKESNLINNDGWTTGVTHADVNNDGLLIFMFAKSVIMALSEDKTYYTSIKGTNAKGIPTFKEEAKNYGYGFYRLRYPSSFF